MFSDQCSTTSGSIDSRRFKIQDMPGRAALHEVVGDAPDSDR